MIDIFYSYYIPVAFFVIGLFVGSFLNVVINRFNTGMSFVSGRSKCFSCGKTLSALELIPIFSYLYQRGKCKNCKSKISIQYMLVEAVTGILFAGVALKLNPFSSFTYFVVTLDLLVIFSLLIAISVYDIKHKIIPNSLVYSFILIAFLYKLILYKAIFHNPSYFFVLMDVFFGLVLFSIFFLFWFLSGGKAMGFGDAKLVFGIGIFLGAYKGVIAMLLSFWTGAVVGIFLLFLKRKSFKMKSEIPFGPFLVLGTVISFFFQINIF